MADDAFTDAMERNIANKRVDWRDKSMKPRLQKNPSFRRELNAAKKYISENALTRKQRVVVNRKGDVSIHGFGKREGN